MTTPSNGNPAPRKPSASPSVPKGASVNRPAAPASPFAEPTFMATSAAAEPLDLVRGEGIALLGLPGSGKTSFLYYLKTRRGDGAVGSRPWRMRTLGGEFDQQTGLQDEAQVATRADVFKEAALQMWRPILGFLPVGPRRKVVIPEIAGETVAAMARAGVPDSPAERHAYERLDAYLRCCDEVIFLASLDGHVGGKGQYSGSGVRRAALDAAGVENALVSAVNVLGRIITLMHDSRPHGERIFISLLVTKIDALKDAPGLDGVALPEQSSEVARLAGSRGRSWISRFLKSDGTTVSFSMNELCQSVEAFADIDVQEAAAFDFMRAHAPAAAEGLSKLSEQPDISLRFYMGGPYGREYTNARGQAVFPPVNVLKQRTMVYEVLEDVVERSFRWRRRTRLRHYGAIAAVAALAFFLTGPALVRVLERNFRTDLASQDYAGAESALRRMDWIPWSWVDRNLSDARREQYAAEHLELLESWTAAKPEDIEDARVAALAKSVMALDPDGDFGQRADKIIRSKNQRAVRDFIEEGRELPATLELNDDSAAQVQRLVHDLRTGEAPWAAKDFQESSRRQAIDTLKVRQKRLKDLQNASQVPASRTPGFDEQLTLTMESCALRIKLLEDTTQPGAGNKPADAAAIREWVRRAIACDDAASLRYAEAKLVASVEAEAEAKQPSSGPQQDKLASMKDVVAQLARTDWSLKQQLERERLAVLVREWVLEELDAMIAGIQSADNGELGKRIDKQKKLLTRVSGLLGERKALAVGEEAWVVAEPEGGSFWKSIGELQARADAIVKLNESKDLPDAVEKDVKASFVGAPRMVVPVKYQPPSAGGAPAVEVRLQPIAMAQQELVADILDSRIVSMDLDPSRIKDPKDTSYDAELASAEHCNSLLDGVGKVLGDRYASKVRLRTAEFAVAKELTRPSPSVQALKNGFDTVATCAVDLPLSNWVLPSLARSSAAPEISSSVLRRIGGMKGTLEVRKRYAEAFIRALDLAQMTPDQAKELIAVAAASDEIGMLPLVAEGLKGMQDNAIEAAKRVLANQGDLQAPPDLASWTKRIQAWLAASQWVDAQGELHDFGVTMSQRTLAQAFEDMRHGKLVSPALRVLQEIGGGTSPSAELREVAKAVADHVALAQKWNLRPVFFHEGDDPGVCKVLLSQKEWTFADVATAMRGAEGAAKAQLANDVEQPDFPYQATGALKIPLPPADPGVDTTTGLRFERRRYAEDITAAAGLRLPSRSEWKQAYKDLKRPVSPASSRDWSAAALQSAGDCTAPPQEFIGLEFGVREWLADSEFPAGNSTSFPDDQLNKNEKARAPDTGIRPALDPYPELLRKACESGR